MGLICSTLKLLDAMGRFPGSGTGVYPAGNVALTSGLLLEAMGRFPGRGAGLWVASGRAGWAGTMEAAGTGGVADLGTRLSG